jgi:hypothetical protein
MAERQRDHGIPHVGVVFWIYVVLIVAGLVFFSVIGVVGR